MGEWSDSGVHVCCVSVDLTMKFSPPIPAVRELVLLPLCVRETI